MLRLKWLLLINLLCFHFAQAAEVKSNHAVKTADGSILKVSLAEYTNANGLRELKIVSNDAARVILGYGRDLNRNGQIDTFFLLGSEGVRSYQRELKTETSKLRALKVLALHGQYSGKTYFTKLMNNIFGQVFFSIDKFNQVQKDYYYNLMDLEALRVSFKQNGAFLTRAERIYVLNLLLEGNQLAYEQLKTGLDQVKKYSLGDALGVVLGGYLLKGAAKLTGKKIAVRVTSGVALRLALRSTMTKVQQALLGLTAKTALKASKSFFLKSLAGVKSEWKFIAFTTGLQAAVEGYVSYDEIKGPNALAMAQNMMGNKAIQENIGISLVDSFMMAGASHAAKTAKARFALLGIIGANSSLVVGKAMDGKQDKKRVIFDAAWSIGIDTSSVLLELKALHHFQAQALKMRNPKLRLVGWAVVLVSELTNNYVYSKASRYVDPRATEGQVVLVPVTVAKN